MIIQFFLILPDPMFHFFQNLDWKYFFLFLDLYFFNCKGNDSAEISTWISIFDGLKKTRPLREGMDAKVFMFPPESSIPPLMLLVARVLLPMCILTWRANNCISRQGECIKK